MEINTQLVSFLRASSVEYVFIGKDAVQTNVIADEIEAQSEKGQYYLIYLFWEVVSKLKENQLKPFSEEDEALVRIIVESKQPGLYTGTKVLKQLVDRISSSCFLEGHQVTTEDLASNQSFFELIRTLYEVCKAYN